MIVPFRSTTSSPTRLSTPKPYLPVWKATPPPSKKPPTPIDAALGPRKAHPVPSSASKTSPASLPPPIFKMGQVLLEAVLTLALVANSVPPTSYLREHVRQSYWPYQSQFLCDSQINDDAWRLRAPKVGMPTAHYIPWSQKEDMEVMLKVFLLMANPSSPQKECAAE